MNLSFFYDIIILQIKRNKKIRDLEKGIKNDKTRNQSKQYSFISKDFN